GWNRTDTRLRDSSTALWSPTDNDRKEAVVVIRSRRPSTANADAATLERLLISAQRSLPQARIGNVTPFTSEQGIAGVRVEVDFVPQGLRNAYHRVHVILIDGEDVLTVLYTARDPDASLAALNLVLGSLHHEEG